MDLGGDRMTALIAWAVLTVTVLAWVRLREVWILGVAVVVLGIAIATSTGVLR